MATDSRESESIKNTRPKEKCLNDLAFVYICTNDSILFVSVSSIIFVDKPDSQTFMILKYTNTKSTLLFFLAFSSRTHTKPEAPHKKLMFAPLQYRPRVAAAAQKSGSLLFYDFYGVMKLMS